MVYTDLDSPIPFIKISCSVLPFFGLVVKLIERADFSIILRPGQPYIQKLFDAPKFSYYIEKMTISFEWKDQGWGNRKGKIWLQIFRGSKMVHETTAYLCGVAPHKWGDVKVSLSSKDAVVRAFRPGDYFRFMGDVGRGGNHAIYVRNFKFLVELQYK